MNTKGIAMTVSPDLLVAWADKIDQRLGPISGRNADALAVVLRKAADIISGMKHPTGSEQFADHLIRLGLPAPWELCEESCGEVLAANKETACTALDTGGAVLDERATQAAIWIICAVNTLAGFKAEIS